MINVANPVPCRLCPLMACPGLRPHREEEIPYIQRFKTGEVLVERGEVLVEQDITRGGLFTLLGGVMMRYRSLEDGRRQVHRPIRRIQLFAREAADGLQEELEVLP